MIKVIKKGYVKQISCGWCCAVLEYQEEDIKESRPSYAEKTNFYRYIKCPCCRNEIIIV